MRQTFGRGLVPAGADTLTMGSSPACDGTSVPTPNVAAIGAWKAGLLLRDLVQEARSDRSRPSADTLSQAAGCCDVPLCCRVLPGQPDRSEAAKHGSGHKSPYAGAGRRHGTSQSQGARQGSREATQKPPGAVATPPPGSPSTAPASVAFFELTLAESERQEETARARMAGANWRRACSRRPSALARAEQAYGAIAQRVALWIGAIRLLPIAPHSDTPI
jgi:hypothetical protein